MARYGKSAQKSVKSAIHRKKSGTLRSSKGGKGGRVKSRKQAIAIGLSEARKKGAKVPRKKKSYRLLRIKSTPTAARLVCPPADLVLLALHGNCDIATVSDGFALPEEAAILGASGLRLPGRDPCKRIHFGNY